MAESAEVRIGRVEQALKAFSDSSLRCELEERAGRLSSELPAYWAMTPAQRNLFHFELDRCECLLAQAPAEHAQDADARLGFSLTYALSTNAIRRLLKIRAWLLAYPPRDYPSLPVRAVLMRRIRATALYSQLRQLGQVISTSAKP